MRARKRKASILDDATSDNRYDDDDEKWFRERSIRGKGNISIRDRGYVSIGGANAYLKEHYNPFVSAARMRERDDELRRSAIRVDRQVARLEHLWQKANEAIAKEMKQLHADCDAFAAATKAQKFWWVQCHVLRLPCVEIEEIAAGYRLMNAETLYDYLQSILRQERMRLQGEADSLGSAASKFWLLTEFLASLPQGRPLALHATVSYATDVVRHLDGVYGFSSTILEREIKLRIGTRPPDGQHGPQSSFLDTVSATRNLRTAYFDQRTNDCARCRGTSCFWCDAGSEEDAPYTTPCFHTAAAPALEVLQEAAYDEVRGKVMLVTDQVELTSGEHIPPELVDLIVDFTMAVEGLPATKKERAAVGAPEWCHMGRAIEGGGPEVIVVS